MNNSIDQNRTIPARIADEMAKQIASGIFSSGDRLTEKTISEKFKISHIPAREALKLLEKEGFIKIYPYKGAIINSIDIEEVQQGAQMHIAILPIILKKSVANINDAILQKLTAILKQAEQSADSRELYELFQDFIFTYYDASGLLYLTSILKNHFKKLTLAGDWYYRHGAQETDTAIKHHKQMLAALKKKDFKSALKIRTDYLKLTMNDFDEKFKLKKA